MTDKTKRIVLIAVCCLLCVAAAVGIAVRFGGNADISSGVVSDDPTQSGNPSVDIDNNGQTDLDVQVETPDASDTDPAQGADSSGLEQTIQADPVKPESPEKPEAPAGTTTLPDDHDGTDVPEEERKTEDEAPPTYEAVSYTHREGDEITAEMVQTVEVGAYNLPSGIMTEKDEVVGKYATADLKVGDYILASKLSCLLYTSGVHLRSGVGRLGRRL